jgi:GMP synthase-like glutamine amidotransferase
LPTLAEEVLLTRACLALDKPIIGIGLGAQILSLAATGGVEATPLEFSVGRARRSEENALGGYLPKRFPQVVYMRDRPVPPDYARVLARDEQDRTSVFQIGERAFGFAGHPGFKRAIAEDLIMEFEEGPSDPGPALAALVDVKSDVEDALVQIMTGLVQATGLMRA